MGEVRGAVERADDQLVRLVGAVGLDDREEDRVRTGRRRDGGAKAVEATDGQFGFEEGLVEIGEAIVGRLHDLAKLSGGQRGLGLTCGGNTIRCGGADFIDGKLDGFTEFTECPNISTRHFYRVGVIEPHDVRSLDFFFSTLHHQSVVRLNGPLVAEVREPECDTALDGVNMEDQITE